MRRKVVKWIVLLCTLMVSDYTVGNKNLSHILIFNAVHLTWCRGKADWWAFRLDLIPIGQRFEFPFMTWQELTMLKVFSCPSILFSHCMIFCSRHSLIYIWILALKFHKYSTFVQRKPTNSITRLLLQKGKHDIFHF